MMRLKCIGFLVLTLSAIFSVMTSANAIVNGDEAVNPDFQAVVFLSSSAGSCTGTFIHPRFILTAAHCLPQCTSSSDDGCVTGSPVAVGQGQATGRDGAVTMIAQDGILAGSGGIYPIDHVYFPRAKDIDRTRPPDVALLRTTIWFAGKIIPVLPHQDRPRPDESKYCPRWEFTWPSVLGYSSNVGTTDRRRRVGRAFAECDLEMDETVFKLDGHGRDGQRGIRTCVGDSGGPVLWETGYGGFAIGGVNSASDDFKVITDTKCPSERGEGFHAFIPRAFLNRVAQTDALCRGAKSWQKCPGVPTPYRGKQMTYLGTEIEQCDKKSKLRVVGIHKNVTIGSGGTADALVSDNEFSWFCGSNDESTTAASGTRYLIVKRALTDSQIIWDSYKSTGQIGSSEDALIIDSRNDPRRGAAVMDATGVHLDMIEQIDKAFHRTFSSNGGKQWIIPTKPSGGEFPTPIGQIGEGVFNSGPAAAVSADGKKLHVVGLGTDNRFWRALSLDGGTNWAIAWEPLGQTIFTSAPAVAVSGDGKQLHIFGLGTDNQIWHTLLTEGTAASSVVWERVGKQRTFISAPAAAVSADGKQLYLFGVSTDNRIWRVSLPDGKIPSNVVWQAIGAGVFTSAPAAAVSSDGKQLHVFGVGMDSRIWRAVSFDGGKTWALAWEPIGLGIFTSAPAAVISGDGKKLHVFGRGAPLPTTPGSFPAPVRIWRAFSPDGGNTWSLAWGAIKPKPH